MADQDVNIRVRTSADTKGAKTAARSIKEIERELRDARKAFRDAKTGSEEFVRQGKRIQTLQGEIRKVGGETKKLGRRGNAGMAVLEFSRMFEDAQYGIRGTLNNIPGLVAMLGGGAGLAGVISLAAVGATQLWSRLGGGAKDAQDPLQKYMETFGSLVDRFEKVEELQSKGREKGLEEAEDQAREALGEIEDETRQALADLSIDSTTAHAAAMLALEKERNRLAALEREATAASGADALNIAKQRLQVARSIFDQELALADMKRKEAIRSARIQLMNASNKASVAGMTEAELAGQAANLSEEIRASQARGESLNADRKARLQSIQGTIATMQGRPGTGGVLKKLRREQSELLTPGLEESQAFARAQAKQGALDDVLDKLKEAGIAQEQASREAAAAADALAHVKELEDIKAKSALEMQITRGLSQDVGGTIDQALATLRKDPGAQFPGAVSGAIESLQRIATDDVSDGEQGGKVAGVLQELAGRLTAKDEKLAGNVEKLVRIANQQADKYDRLRDHIETVEARLNQLQ